MKTTIYFLLLLLLGRVALAQPDHTTASINLQLAEHCQWRYLYFPNLEAYYDMWNATYWFRWQGQWWQAEQLPEWLGGYSMFKKVYVPIPDYDDDHIIQMLPVHRKRYPYVFNIHAAVVQALLRQPYTDLQHSP